VSGRALSRRGFFAAALGRRPATDPTSGSSAGVDRSGEVRSETPAPPSTPPLGPSLQGLVPAGQVFSLEAFYRARAERRSEGSAEDLGPHRPERPDAEVPTP
jgi:hypothetical protein